MTPLLPGALIVAACMGATFVAVIGLCIAAKVAAEWMR